MQRLELPNLETPQRSHQLVPAAHQSDSTRTPMPSDSPSRFGIFFWTGIVTIFWLGGATGFFLGFYGPGSEQTLSTSEIVGLVFLLLLPVFLIWFLAVVIHYAMGLRQSSTYLSAIASRLTEPEKSASEEITQLGQAVRTQLDSLNTGIEDALSKVGKLEEDIYQYSDNLSQTATNAEKRLNDVRTKLQAEREALDELSRSFENKGIEVSQSIEKQTASLKEVSEKTFEQIEGADHQLQNRIEMFSSAADAALKTSTQTEKQLEEQYSKLNSMSEAALTRAGDIANRYDQQREAIDQTTSRLSDENSKLESSLETQRLVLGQIGDLVSSQAQQIENSVAESAKTLESTVISAAARAARMGEDFTKQAQSVKASGEEVTEAMTLAAQAAQAAAEEAQNAIDGRVASITTAIEAAFATAEEVAQRSQQALASRVTSIAGDIETAGETMESVVQRTEQSLAQQINSIAKNIETASETAAGVAHQSRQAFAEHAQSITQDIEQASSKAAEVTQQSRQAFAEQAQVIAQDIDLATSRATDAAQQSRQALLEQVKTISQDIEAASQQADELINRSQGTLAARLSEATQIIRSAGSSAEELVAQSQRNFGERVKALSQELEESGAQIDEVTSKAQQSFAQRASLFNSGVRESGEAAARATTEAQARLESQLSDIRGQISQTSDIVDSATEKLTSTVDKILEASSDASEQLESAVLDLEARLAEFPDHAKETTFSIRKVIEDQISVFTEITDEAAEKARTLDAALQAKLKFNREALRGLLSYLDLDNIESVPIPPSEAPQPTAEADIPPPQQSRGELSAPPEPLRIEAPPEQSTGGDWRRRPDLQPFGEVKTEGAAPEPSKPEASAATPLPQAMSATKPRVNFRPPLSDAAPQDGADDEGDVKPDAAPKSQNEIDDLAERLTARLQKAKGVEPKSEATSNIESPDSSEDKDSVDDTTPPPRQSGMPHFQQTIANQIKEGQDAVQTGTTASEPAPAEENADTGKPNTEPLSPGTGQSSMASKRGWKWRDILAAADSQATPPSESIQLNGSKGEDIPRTSLHMIETLQAMTVDLDRALEDDPPVELVRRYLNGERNLFARRLVQSKQSEMQDRIQSKYDGDQEFKHNADRYLSQFEELLGSAREEDRENILAETYLSSDTGKVYLLIAKALGRVEQ